MAGFFHNISFANSSIRQRPRPCGAIPLAGPKQTQSRRFAMSASDPEADFAASFEIERSPTSKVGIFGLCSCVYRIVIGARSIGYQDPR
jgi:hypothetical protein